MLRSTVMLLSPAKLSGRRGDMLFEPKSEFELARQLREPGGAPLGALFSFVSGLYFRGKAEYARRFAQTDTGLAALVMTAGGGLCGLSERVTLDRLRGWSAVSIHHDNPHFTAPLERQASALLQAHDESTRFVLLGSVASHKYVAPLLNVFGERLLYPSQFLGRGDMSRGSLLLRAVGEGRELDYARVAELAHG